MTKTPDDIVLKAVEAMLAEPKKLPGENRTQRRVARSILQYGRKQLAKKLPTRSPQVDKPRSG